MKSSDKEERNGLKGWMRSETWTNAAVQNEENKRDYKGATQHA